MQAMSLKEKIEIMKLMPRFNGETPLRQYMECFNSRMEGLGLNQQQALEILKSCLDGRAADKFKLIKTEAGTAKTWEQWINEFAQQLATPHMNEVARDLLNARKKKQKNWMHT
uniref:Uncharacterized protein n=1 Tax=Panagrolaimus sp. ES5 TaxID=591445 RepID=A0AC34GYT2_9BILA